MTEYVYTDPMQEFEDLYLKQHDLQKQHEEMRKAAIPPEVRAELEAIDAELTPKLKAIEEKLAIAEDKVKATVLAQGTTIKGNVWQAVWSKPRTSWDAKLLDKLAEKYPDILLAKTEGKPSVSLRQIK